MKTDTQPDKQAIYWLMTGLTLAALPHFIFQPWWVSIIFICMLGWRLMHHIAAWPLPSNQHWLLKGLLTLIAAVSILLLLNHYGTTIGRDAGVGLLTIMLSLKVVEIHSRRDFYLSCFLGYFLIITNFFYTQAIPVVLLMFVVVTIMTACLISIHVTPDSMTNRSRFRLAGQMLLQSLPIMLLLFVLFPRVAGPLWGLPQDAHSAASGMDDTLTLGKISQLVQSDEVAFRVKFDQQMPPPSQLYWRGPVLWRTDGQTWRELDSQRLQRTTPDTTLSGQPYSYTTTLEAHDNHWLFALDFPAAIPDSVSSYITADGQIRSKKNIKQRTRFQLTSYTDFSFNAEEDPFINKALELPDGKHPRSRELAQNWIVQTPEAEQYIQQVLEHFRQQSFYYTLSPPTLSGDVIDNFLFESRRGFCEHYAASFTVLMRAAGIPARIVTGYLGGEINPVDGLLVIRQRDAHAWSEVWLPDKGWIRIDPTAAVSAERVEQGMSNLLPAERRSPLLFRHSDMLTNLWLTLRYNWDALNSAWDMWVLSYGPERQKELLSKIGMDNPDWQQMAKWLFILITTFLLALAVLLLYQRQHSDPLSTIYLQFCRKLARVGISRQANEGPLHFCQRAQARLPAYQSQIADISDCYMQLRYGNKPVKLEALRQKVTSFKPKLNHKLTD